MTMPATSETLFVPQHEHGVEKEWATVLPKSQMSNDVGPFHSAGFRPRQLASLKRMASELDSGDDEDDESKGYQRDYEKEWG